jgi:hypothetical protein
VSPFPLYLSTLPFSPRTVSLLIFFLSFLYFFSPVLLLTLVLLCHSFSLLSLLCSVFVYVGSVRVPFQTEKSAFNPKNPTLQMTGYLFSFHTFFRKSLYSVFSFLLLPLFPLSSYFLLKPQPIFYLSHVRIFFVQYVELDHQTWIELSGQSYTTHCQCQRPFPF